MTTKGTVYERTYQYYIAQFDKIDLQSVEQKLGVHVGKNEIIIPLFGKPHKVSKSKRGRWFQTDFRVKKSIR